METTCQHTPGRSWLAKRAGAWHRHVCHHDAPPYHDARLVLGTDSEVVHVLQQALVMSQWPARG
jgi:hypothetical protein